MKRTLFLIKTLPEITTIPAMKCTNHTFEKAISAICNSLTISARSESFCQFFFLYSTQLCQQTFLFYYFPSLTFTFSINSCVTQWLWDRFWRLFTSTKSHFQNQAVSDKRGILHGEHWWKIVLPYSLCRRQDVSLIHRKRI